MQSLRRSDVPWLAALALAAGLAIRVAALSLPGTSDVGAWKTWSYVAITEGPAHVYGHGFPPATHILTFGDTVTVANYPPLGVYELAVIGRVYRFVTGGAFLDTPALTMTFKGAIVLADAAMALLIFGTVRKFNGGRAAWWSAATYSISPAVLLATILGYIDVFFAVPAVGAVVAASSGRPIVAGALFGAALMTKPQALLVGPAVALALWNAGDADGDPGAAAALGWLAQARRRLFAATASATIFSAVVALPVVFAGTTLNMLRALGSLVRHDMLSGNACNLWWIVGYVIQVAAADRGDPAPARTIADIVQISSLPAAWYVSPRLVGAALTGAATVWALGVARGARDVGLVAALAAFVADAVLHPLRASAREPLLRRDSAPGARGDTAARVRTDPDRARNRVRAEPVSVLWRRRHRAACRRADDHGHRCDGAVVDRELRRVRVVRDGLPSRLPAVGGPVVGSSVGHGLLFDLQCAFAPEYRRVPDQSEAVQHGKKDRRIDPGHAARNRVTNALPEPVEQVCVQRRNRTHGEEHAPIPRPNTRDDRQERQRQRQMVFMDLHREDEVRVHGQRRESSESREIADPARLPHRPGNHGGHRRPRASRHGRDRPQ